MAQRKNYRKIPPEIQRKIGKLAVDDYVVACAKVLRAADVGAFAHLKLKIENGELVIPPPSVPPGRMGTFSDANRNGKEVSRKDLPMIQKTYSWETPNWGDWSNGSHTHSRTRDVYQRDFISPKEVTLSIELMDRDSANGTLTVKFAVDQVISRAASDFDDDLLYNLNILQENVGAIDVFASTASFADYVATIHVQWEILPSGNIDFVVRRMLEGKRSVSSEYREVTRERVEAMEALKPKNYIAGTNEFRRYFGAVFEDDFIVFENLGYGNAIYVMHEGWQKLSQRSRIDLLKGPRDQFERIVHNDGWATRLGFLLGEHRKAMKKRAGGSR